MGINGKMSLSISCAYVVTLLMTYTASYITQVQLIFQPKVQQGFNLELPSYLSDPLLYVQFFRFISGPDDHPELAMWSVEHMYTQDENGNHHREGAII
jgi:hypothetical protein